LNRIFAVTVFTPQAMTRQGDESRFEFARIWPDYARSWIPFSTPKQLSRQPYRDMQ
jgi:hypothetical protein